jgi:hypothetical protein
MKTIEKVSIAYLISAMFSVVVAWFLNYFPSGVDLVQRISFLAADPPALPGGGTPQRILGVHFFGDFQSAMNFTRIDNPYLTSFVDRSNLLPSSRVFLFPFAALPIHLAFLAYLLITLGTLIFTVLKLMRYLETKNNFTFTNFQKIIFAILVFGFSQPLIVDLDRGNFYTLTISLIVLAILKFQNRNWLQGFLLVLIAVSIKSFLLFTILPFLPWRKFKLILKGIVAFVFLNVLSILTYSMGFWEVVKGIYLNQLNYTSENFIGKILDTGTLVSSIARIHQYIYGTEKTTFFLLNNLSLSRLVSITFLIFALITAFKASNFEIKLFFSLSLISFAPPFSGWYSMSWISYALLACVFSLPNNKQEKVFRWLVYITSWCLLIPLWIQFPIQGLGYHQQFILPPILSFLFSLYFAGRIQFKNLSKKLRISTEKT